MTNFGENMITLNLTPKQFEAIKTALLHYAEHMTHMIEACLAAQQAKSAGTIPVAVHHSMVGKSEAPWGLKKDGTPKARPGRKTTKVRKARA